MAEVLFYLISFLQKDCYFGNGLFSSVVGESEEQVNTHLFIHSVMHLVPGTWFASERKPIAETA